MIPMIGFLVLLALALATGFVKFGEPTAMEASAPIQLFRVDNTYNLHFRNIGGVIFMTWFAIIFVTADGDTATRLYGWENSHPQLDNN